MLHRRNTDGNHHVIVLAKAPVPGRVKTRLCPPCTPVEAAALAEAALADTLDAVAGCGASRRVLALDGDPGAWLPPGFDVVPQRGHSFGDRLAGAWASAGGPTVQIGMDTPQVTPDLLDVALAALEEQPAALGLAADGGWWALGLRRPNATGAAVFRHVPWSTAATGRAQHDRLLALGLATAPLPVLVDLDTIGDLGAVIEHGNAPRTARAAVELGLPVPA